MGTQQNDVKAPATAPAFRASVLHALIKTIENHPGGVQIMDRCDPRDLAFVRDSFRTDWVPANRGLCLYRASFDEGGAELVHDVSRDNVISQGSIHPLFRPLMRGAVNVFGGGPVAVFKQLPRALTLSNRATGTIEVKQSRPHEVVYHWIGLPPVLQDRVWIEGQRGVSVGVLRLLDIHGSCEAHVDDGDPSRIEFVVTW